MIKLNASALPRVLACLGSVGLVAALGAINAPETDSAREGTAAHYTAECLLRGETPPASAPNGVTIDADMREHAAAYAATVPMGDHVGVELACNWWLHPKIEIACKVDAYWIDGDTLHIRDFKYGWRIVEPEGNWQLISYAIGVIRKLNLAPSRICMGIYQPRPFHLYGPLRTWTVTLGELIALHDDLLMSLQPLVEVTPISPDILSTGEHCEYCPAAAQGTCPAYLRAVTNAVDVAMRGGPAELSPAALGRELVNLKRADDVLKQRREWVNTLVKHALQTDPTNVPGWAVETQKGNTTWTIDPAELQRQTNVDVFKPPALVTPAEAKRRGIADELYTAHTTRPNIGDKLVRRDADAYVRRKLGKKK